MAAKTPPPTVQNKNLRALPYALAGIILLMALLQLVNFEAFALSIAAYEVINSRDVSTLAVILIMLEVFSLPFLLRLWLSKPARATSALLVLLQPTAWTLLVLQAAARQLAVPNVGFFGNMLPLALSPFSVGIALVLLGAAICNFMILGGRKAFAK